MVAGHLPISEEQNASTSTVRIAGSSQANPYACIAAGGAWGVDGGAGEIPSGEEDMGNLWEMAGDLWKIDDS